MKDKLTYEYVSNYLKNYSWPEYIDSRSINGVVNLGLNYDHMFIVLLTASNLIKNRISIYVPDFDKLQAIENITSFNSLRIKIDNNYNIEYIFEDDFTIETLQNIIERVKNYSVKIITIINNFKKKMLIRNMENI